MKIIDPHLHLFDLAFGKYGWLRPENPPYWSDKSEIQKNFHEHDLILPTKHFLEGFVHIEAGFDNKHPWREIDWLSETVSRQFRAVAGISLLNESFDRTLQELSKRPNVVGVRDILDEQAVLILTSSQCQDRFAQLAESGLSFDAQLSVADSMSFNALLDTVKRHHKLTFILNHGGWPPAGPKDYAIWLRNMEALAACENVAVKLSGWEMNQRQWHVENASGTVEDVLSVFGEQRVMLASNFPLCTWRFDYKTFWSKWLSLINEKLGEEVSVHITYRNAKRIYKF